MSKKKLQTTAMSLIAPLLSLAFLGGIAAENATHLTPVDVEPYHARTKKAIESISKVLGSWTGQDEKIPDAAMKLLRNPVTLNRNYVDYQPGRARVRQAYFLIVQCRDSRDMVGHYPPVCYPAHGQQEMSRVTRDWKVRDRVIPGMQYEFKEVKNGQTKVHFVHNFIVMPGTGIVRDMKGVAEGSEDYQRRYYGAAQFQVVMSADIPAEERDEIFAALIGPNLRVIDTLETIGTADNNASTPQTPTTMMTKTPTGQAGGNAR